MKRCQCQFDSIILAQISNTNTTLCAECPSGVTITPDVGPYEPGDLLTCDAAVGYEPTYTWTGSDGVGVITVTITGSTYTIPEGAFDLTCTATLDELTTCTGTQQDIQKGTAVGKC